MEEFPPVKKMKNNELFADKIDWENVIKNLRINHSAKEVGWIKSGEVYALNCLNEFLDNKFEAYHQLRNDPTADGHSNLSPYLHFG